MPYNYVTFSTAKSQLARRLDDPDKVFWNDTELGTYLIEALRVWGALTSYWRFEFILNLVQDTVWYDIADSAIAPNTLRAFTVTDREIYTQLQYSLLEPPTAQVWTGSNQYAATDLIQAVQRRRDELVSSSGCTITRQLVDAATGRTYLNDRTIDIRRIAWLPVTVPDNDFVNSPLWPDDAFGLQSYDREHTIEEPGTPSQYRQSTEPPLSFDVDIDPAIPGQYEVLTVNAGADLTPDNATIMNVPDDFTWIVKYGALTDLFSRDANARDNLRAQYCQIRYTQGLAVLFNAPSILTARIGNLLMDIDSVQNTDDYRPGWQAESASTPDLLIESGLNLIGFAPAPDSGPYSITLTVVQNAPIPQVPEDAIQVGRDEYDAILNYAQHAASLKMGGTEFIATIPLLQMFLRQAALSNSKLNALGEYSRAIYALGRLQEFANSVYSTSAPDDADASASAGATI